MSLLEWNQWSPVLPQTAADDRPASHAVLAAVRAQLQESPYPGIRRIACEFREGVLTLRGRLPSFYQKQVVQTLAGRVQGIREIQNRVDVVTSPEPRSPDRRTDGVPDPLEMTR